MPVNTPPSELFQSLSAPGVHETQIAEMFSGKMKFDGNQPVFDKPLVIMAFSNRSGSNLLADYLRQTRRFAGFRETLNWDEVKLGLSKAPVASFPDYIESLVKGVTPRTYWGVKASWDQMAMLARANIAGMFPSVKVIHSMRSDLLAQAVSHWIAHQTGKWTSTHSGRDVAPVFDGRTIEGILLSVQKANCYVDCICRAMNWPRIGVIYENLQKTPQGPVERVARFVGVPLDDWKPGEPRISMQRDNINTDFTKETLQRWRSTLTV